MHLLALFLGIAVVTAKDQCAPATWSAGSISRRGAISNNASFRVADSSSSIVGSRDVQPGQVNCRYSATTKKSVNYYTCTEMATRYGISVDVFFQLNPELTSDCGNIQPKTEYCVAGFIEPVRATSGLCGPKNDNATCLGTDFQCCNAETWTCGNTDADCAAGTCYEGACAGDEVYSTDGTCGREHGNRLCAGKWGDCCNVSGRCGTGEGFCGEEVCQSGNCPIPVAVPGDPSWVNGNTTDGTCGGESNFTCNVVYGYCCNKDNICGSLASDCGAGCQPHWGNCSSVDPGSMTTKSSTGTTTKPTITSTALTSKSSTKTTTSLKSSSTVSKTSTSLKSSSTASKTTASSKSSSTAFKTTTALSSLPTCGQTCFNNMLNQYSSLGCQTKDPRCLCSNVNFGYGLRDCSNGACGTSVASTVIAYGSAYCSSALAASTTKPSPTKPTTIPAVSSLPACGQTCFNNMLGQYSALGCQSKDPRCLCSNVNFGYGLRDCSNGACGTAVASTVIAYGSAYCSSALAARATA